MKNKENGFGAVEVLIVVVLVGLIGLVGWRVWNTNSENKPQDITSQNQTVQDDSKTLEIGYSDRVIFAGSQNEEARALGNRITSFYELVIENSDKDSPCTKITNDANTLCESYRPYLTDAAIQQIEEPKSFSLLACGQAKILAYSIGEPKISGNSATAEITHLQFGQPIKEAETGTITLLKSVDTWQIDSFACRL